MIAPTNPHDWIARASQKIGVPLVRHTATKATGPCPHCHAGVDRLIVFEAGNYWCNHCHQTGWWMAVADGVQRIAEARVERHQHQTVLLAQMAACLDWRAYQSALQVGGRVGLWLEHGMTEDDIGKWGLGYCERCPLCPGAGSCTRDPLCPGSPSLTIPVFARQRLVDIRHRLLACPKGDRYRSHRTGLIPSIFNQDALIASQDVLVLEGEKKAIIAVRAGFPASLGLPGAMFGGALLDVLAGMQPAQRVTLALDPDKAETAEQLALLIGDAARVADFPSKPDDFLLRYGGAAYVEVIRQARPVRLLKRGAR
jgi:hypothetical protein